MVSAETARKITVLLKKVSEDREYAHLLAEYQTMEYRLGELADHLTAAEQNVLWDYKETSDAIHYRILEVICEQFELR